jgi:hypothetical protein
MRRSFGWAEKEREQTGRTVVRQCNRSRGMAQRGKEVQDPGMRHRRAGLRQSSVTDRRKLAFDDYARENSSDGCKINGVRGDGPRATRTPN